MSTDMGRHFTCTALIKYTLPSIAMMLFTSIYGIVDGLFVSNFAGTTAFAAVNLILPVVMILSATGFMMGTGGSALIGIARGEGDDARANRWFTQFTAFCGGLGILLSVIGFLVMEPLAKLLGASGELLSMSIVYGRISMVSLTFFCLQTAFQTLFSTAGKPKIGLAVTVAAGVLNMVLDAVFVGLLDWGVAGAAWATVASELVGGGIPLIYFARKNTSALRFAKTPFEWRVIGRACFNGSSEMVTEITLSLVAVLYNWQLLRFLGENGVAAYGVIMYAWMLFGGVYLGYSVGSAPLMSFQYGAKNHKEMRSLLKNGLLIMGCAGVLLLAAAEALSYPISRIFTGYDADLLALTVHAFRIYSIAYLVEGFTVLGSSLYTSLGNGKLSAIISFVRTMIFEVGAVLLLPLLFGVDGIWYSVTVAEVAALVLAAVLFAVTARAYGFVKPRTPKS